MTMLRYVLLVMMLLPLQSCAFYYSAAPIEAWVIDAETGKPLEGVIVTANWQLKGGLEGGNDFGQMMVMEAVTDKSGRFYFPAWGPKRNVSDGHIKQDGPQLLLFKSGYRYLALFNETRVTDRPGPFLKSDWNGKTIKLERFKETDLQTQYKNLLNFSKGVDSFATWHIDPCQWTNLPTAVNKMMQERKKLEAQGVRSVMDRTLDRQLLEGESYFIKQCGSTAQTFIEGTKK